jgi:hypothetical protein
MKGIRVLTYDWKYVSRTDISTVKSRRNTASESSDGVEDIFVRGILGGMLLL